MTLCYGFRRLGTVPMPNTDIERITNGASRGRDKFWGTENALGRSTETDGNRYPRSRKIRGSEMSCIRNGETSAPPPEADTHTNSAKGPLLTRMYGPAAVRKREFRGYRNALICIRPV